MIVSNIVCIFRQSQGTDDSVSLELQRERVVELAAEMGEHDPDIIDLGVHTGFSVFMDSDGEEKKKKRIDTNEQILSLLEDLDDGKYDYLLAWDDTRVARDQFYWVVSWHAKNGGCELKFIEEKPENDLTFRVERAVESEVKMKEITKTRKAIKHRQEQGHDHGRPRFGMVYNEAGTRQVPGEDFELVKEIWELKDNGHTYDEIENETGVSRGTAHRVIKERDWYETRLPQI